ncbi:hypothetical protein MKK75_33950 [Methylobacterium sp. J-030]|uniref:hypothetical protein n=1 Tax=Methylobacterium sp. J-030 TaxID=2836627 RepID=UPI001FBA3C10|nr:hypothetical protein [Methylobacterium sp. J-030]MCJ2073740.1 hypothetical protein [Methylobacterium sp. J-030]
MTIHPEFDEMTERFFQDIDRLFGTEKEVFQFLIRPFSQEQRVSLRNYLDHLVGEEFSDEEILNAWNKSKAQWLFYSAQPLRLMLAKIRDNL